MPLIGIKSEHFYSPPNGQHINFQLFDDAVSFDKVNEFMPLALLFPEDIEVQLLSSKREWF